MHLEKTFYTYRKFQKLQANDAISLHYYFGKTLILKNIFRNFLYSFVFISNLERPCIHCKAGCYSCNKKLRPEFKFPAKFEMASSQILAIKG